MNYIVMALLVCSLGGAASAFAHEDHKEHHKAHKALPPVSSESLYNATTAWRDSTSKDVKLGDFRGQRVILTMAYTSCTFTCPMTIAKLTEIERALSAKGITDFKIVIASFDPERDTPEHIAKYIKDKKLSPRWTILSPRSAKDVRVLAALLGVTYSKDKKGEYSHSNIISLLDAEGVVRERLNGIAADHEPLVAGMASKKSGL